MTALAKLPLRWASLLALIAAWELTARAHVFTEFLLPSFSVVVTRLIGDVVSGDLLLGVGLTLYRALAGFALAAAAGVAIGILIARLPLARWFFDPLVSIGLPMPKIAFLPVFILWFGVFDASKILMAAFSAIFPVIVASWAAAEGVERVMLWSALSLGAGRRQLLWEIALPAALPQIFTGLQVALPISLIVEIVSEMAMGGEGIGGTIITEMRFADSPGVFSGIIAIALVGSILVKAMELIRRRLLVWHAETAR
ncbi:MAG TPA: ABC transporter permease subunit [Stellaceae bacterium]|nr:ABC transporter permease subunit [Stellaceae bacterium]